MNENPKLEVPDRKEGREISRRKFLRNILLPTVTLGVVAVADEVLGRIPGIQAQAQPETTKAQPQPQPETTVESERNPGEVPPSLMLHSRHADLLPAILDSLIEKGYRGITYKDYWDSMQPGAEPLPEKSIIISIDDITAVANQGTWDTFMEMQRTAEAKGFPVVFAMNTRPDELQDEERWDTLAELSRSGWIEIATHGSYHSNLNNPNFTIDDYRAEIVDSANMIEQRTGQDVQTLITPFGSGYDRTTGIVSPEVIDASREAGINFIVGILDGRQTLDTSNINPSSVYHVGRMIPGAHDTIEGFDWELGHWRPRIRR